MLEKLKYKTLLFAVFAVFATACSLHNVGPQFKHIDPEFIPYVEMFESLYGRSIRYLGMGFAHLGDNIAGLCRKWTTGHREIKINPHYWHDASPFSRTGLIFHELGHCVLDRDHDYRTFYFHGSTINDFVPKSLMYPFNFYSERFLELKDYYFSELFNQNTTEPSFTSDFLDDCVITF